MKMLPAIRSHLSHKRARNANLPDESRGKIGFAFVSPVKRISLRGRRIMKTIAVFLLVGGLSLVIGQAYEGRHALFVKTSSSAEGKDAHSRARRTAPVSAADVLAQNILEWIQGIYRQGARKPRQQSADPPGYLPPYSTQRPPERPRPFQPPSTGQQPLYSSPARNEVSSYPYPRPSTSYPAPNAIRSSTVQPPPYSSSQKPSYLPPNERSTYRPSSHDPRPTSTSSYGNTGSSAFSSFGTSLGPTTATGTVGSSSQPGYSTSDHGYSSSSFGGTVVDGTAAAGKFSTPGGFSTGYGYPTRRPSPTYVPAQQGGTVSGVSSSTGYLYPTGSGTDANSEDQGIAGGYPSTSSSSSSSSSGYPSATPGVVFPPQDAGSGTSAPGVARPTETGTQSGASPTGEGSSGSGTVSIGGTADADDDSKHPPHIHALDVACSKTMMTIDIEFNRVFDGLVYSKGFYANPECRYVEENSGRTKYSFTVSLDSCGTRFINDFAGEAGQAYLENVLVLQNEPGIQEVWDTVRRVRCLWEGNINKALAVNLSVDMLNQETVTFSGDTAVAKLDIQVGRGPFAPAADGLVKIGEIMTLVVSVEGDPAFDLQVRDCVARDDSSRNTIQLTDEAGCIQKPKLFGAFQKTNDTGNTGASIIAYAYFQAFKFPDVMDLIIECNVELCKTDCEPCPEPNQQIEPRRRRRSVSYAPSGTPLNGTTGVLLPDPIRVARGFKVIMVDDLSKASNQLLEQLEETAGDTVAWRTTNLCMTYSGFYVAISFMLTTILVATLSALVLYVKLHRVYRSKATHS